MTIRGDGLSRRDEGLDTSERGLITAVRRLFREVFTGNPIARMAGDLDGAPSAPKLSTRSAALLHTFLSSRHTDTTAATVVKGDLIAGTGSPPTWSRLPIGAQNTVLRPSTGAGAGMVWSGATTTPNGTAPTSGVATTAPATTLLRIVNLTVTLTPTVGADASLAIAVETGLASGSYATYRTLLVASGGAATTFDYSFPVPGGWRYILTKGAAPGVTETIDAYTVTDA